MEGKTYTQTGIEMLYGVIYKKISVRLAILLRNWGRKALTLIGYVSHHGDVLRK